MTTQTTTPLRLLRPFASILPVWMFLLMFVWGALAAPCSSAYAQQCHERVSRVAEQPASGVTRLQMAYAEARIRNPQAWTPQGRIPTALHIIYSAYPADTASWLTPYHHLMRERLDNLYALDNRLRTVPLVWVAQTAASSGKQARNLFHGADIHWKPAAMTSAEKTENTENSEGTAEQKDATENLAKEGASQRASEDSLTPRSTRSSTPSGLPLLAGKADTLFHQDLEKMRNPNYSENMVASNMRQVQAMREGRSPAQHPVWFRVLQRNPQWDDMLVVMDWTGSMHPYGGQLLYWMERQMQADRVTHLVLYNDGDDNLYTGTTPIGLRDKPIGAVGGIYYVDKPAQSIDRVVNAMRYVMRRGDGGDLPENDIEALLRAKHRYPNHTGPVVLMADNGARIRDLALIDKIDFPVHIILGGLFFSGIHSDYVELAWKTGGSLHTLDRSLVFDAPYQMFSNDRLEFEGTQFHLLPEGVVGKRKPPHER